MHGCNDAGIDPVRVVTHALRPPVRASRLAARAGAFALLLAATAAHAAPGRTPATYEVSSTGEASYSIPIAAPPGTAGLTPQLALTYGHRSGASLAGVGWAIAGASVIHRCASTWAQDGVVREVRNDAQDRFCLDGNRLRLVAGTYGQAGSEYRTELETFARIRASGSAGNGPAQFTVERKDGLVHEYGATADSRIESQGQSTARAWALNRIRDRAGNAILFEYAEDAANGSFRIARVRYGGNASQGVAPTYELRFTYEARPAGEIDSRYLAGSLVKEVTRLDRIEVLHAGEPVRRYELTHEPSLSAAARSRLASVQECASAECLQPTVFAYQDGTPGLNAERATTAAIPATVQPLPLDVNGDGRDDLVYPSSATSGAGTWMVMLAEAGGHGAPISTGIPNTGYLGAIPIDYDADGRDDLLVPYASGRWWVMLGHAGGLAAPLDTGAPATATGTGVNARAFDVNGDGLDDLVWADLVGYGGGDAIRYRLREWGGAFAASVQVLAGPVGAEERITSGVFANWAQKLPRRLVDFNGDGRSDLVYRRSLRVVEPDLPTRYFYFLDVICQGGTRFASWSSDAASEPHVGDFNGDGRSDVFYYDSTGRWRYRFSRGTGFGPVLDAGSIAGYTFGWVILDWDADGYDDVLSPHTSSGTWHLRRSTGEALAAPVGTGLAFSGASAVLTADVDGDGLRDLSYVSGGAWRYRLHAGLAPDLLLRATDGHGNVVEFAYASLTAAAYTRHSDARYPSQDYAGSLPVVTGLSVSDGVGGTQRLAFSYYGGRSNLQGRGFEGFDARLAVDERNGLRQWQYFSRDFPLTGTPRRVVVAQSGEVAVTRTDFTWSTHSYATGTQSRHFPYVSTTTRTSNAVGGPANGQPLGTERVTYTVDAATGTPLREVRTVTEAASGNGLRGGTTWRRETEYAGLFTDQGGDNWCIGRPTLVADTRSHSGTAGQAQVRRMGTSWDGFHCRPTQTVLSPGDPKRQVTTQFGYDAFGNVTTRTVTPVGLPVRVDRLEWGQNGQRPVSVTNALGHVSRISWHAALGLPAGTTDANGLSASWEYDAFGRLAREARPDGTSTTWQYQDCSAAGCSASQHRTTVTVAARDSTGAVIRDERYDLDRLDRPVGMARKLLGGGHSTTAIEYDSFGRVKRESSPCLGSGCSQHWTSYEYDVIGRLVRTTRPQSAADSRPASTAYLYLGLTVRAMDPQDKVTTQVFDALGRLARTIDHAGYAVSFDHDAGGNLVEATDSLGNTLRSDLYDSHGLLTTSFDANRGGWRYEYDALGNLVSQTDANGRTTTWTWDVLSRPLARVMPEGTGSITSAWTWGTSAAAREIGRLKRVEISGQGVVPYAETYAYDSLGRLARTQYTEGTGTHSVDFGYSGVTGSLETLAYPATSDGYRLRLRYREQNGHLLQVEDAQAPVTVFWRAEATNARGEVVDETLGNGIRSARDVDPVNGLVQAIRSGPGGTATVQNLQYQWDAAGNLTQRRDVLTGATESFAYDDLHRLVRADTGTATTTVGYDALGNITQKSGVGTYAYRSSRPHAVTETTPAGGPVRSYGYDANGNMTSRDGGELLWYANDLPKRIRRTAGSSTDSSAFQYTPDGRRWRHEYDAGGTVATQVSLGGLVDRVTQGPVTDYRHLIRANGQVVALYSRKSSGAQATRYVLRDHLGSTDVVSAANGATVLRESFDAHGARRAPGWAGVPSSGDLATMREITRDGYTGHEHLDSTGLVHMNGRVYDPQLGRFLSADPLVDGPGLTQGWNRYSYVRNRPLSLVDPLGFSSSSTSATQPRTLPIDSGRPQLSTFEQAVVRSVFMGVTCSVGACPLGVAFALTWHPSSNSWGNSPRPSGGGFVMPSAGGLSAPLEREPVIRPASPRPPQHGTERRPATFDVATPDFPSTGMSIEAVQVFLDVVSVTSVPIASEVAGLASGVIYALQGDMVGAALAGVGIVPVIGTAADVSRTGIAARAVGAGAERSATHWNPMNGPGPLGERVGATFRGSSYTESVTSEATTFYRVHGGKAGALGPYWTRTPPAGPLQSRIDSALLPQWGNTAENVTTIQAPAGVTIFEGSAAGQGGLVGGGNQVFIQHVDPSWIVK
jgi:RHS repeat-associated protein